MYRESGIWNDLKMQFRYGTGTTRLIMAILGVFIITKLLLLVDFLTQSTFFSDAWKYLSLPSSLDLLVRRPWTIITFQFYHTGFWHLLFNLLGLYWFGRVVGSFLGESKVFPIFILGGIAGAFLYVLSYNVLPVFEPVRAASFNIGASGGVLALLLAGATLIPTYTFVILFIGAVKLRWIALAYVLLDLISIPGGNAGGHITHLGGALFGFCYAILLQKGTDLSRIVYFFSELPDKLREWQRKRKLRVHHSYRTRTKVEAGTKKQNASSSRKKLEISNQDRLDAILDKINQSGYDSLSKEEKDFLFLMSKED